MKKTVSILAGCLALPASLLSTHAAGFTDYFALTPPDKDIHYEGGSFGNWTGIITQPPSNPTAASIDTTGAPDSVTLTALPVFFVGDLNRGGALQNVITSQAILTINAPSAGTFTVSYSLSLNSAQALYLDDGVWTYFDPGLTFVSLILEAGEEFGFRVDNTDVRLLGERGASLANGGDESLTLRNPSFTPVPEPSTVAGGVFLAGLAGWACLRARRQG